MFPNTKSEHRLAQLWTIPKCSATGQQGEEITSSLSTSPAQEAVESRKKTPYGHREKGHICLLNRL